MNGADAARSGRGRVERSAGDEERLLEDGVIRRRVELQKWRGRRRGLDARDGVHDLLMDRRVHPGGCCWRQGLVEIAYERLGKANAITFGGGGHNLQGAFDIGASLPVGQPLAFSDVALRMSVHLRTRAEEPGEPD